MSWSQEQFLKKRYTAKLELGSVYTVWYWGKILEVQFIKVTEKGYNFLNPLTSSCILKKHVYCKKDTQQTFWLSDFFRILKKH
jgi:hypothetical protein